MSLERKQESYQKGVAAEALAADMLCEKGCEILEMRYKTRFGEVDIIAKDSDSLVFVEVKARKKQEDGLYAVSAKARARIENAALHYMSEHATYADLGMCFDVVVISEGDKEVGAISVSHLDNAWFSAT
jgi:putative endonuclease